MEYSKKIVDLWHGNVKHRNETTYHSTTSVSGFSWLSSLSMQLEVTKYQGFDVMTKEQAADFINDNLTKQFGRAGEWVQYGIEHKESKQLIGDCAIKRPIWHKNCGNRNHHFTSWTKKGYAKEVMMGLLSFFLTQKGVHRVVENCGCWKHGIDLPLNSIGFRQEGHFIENVFLKENGEVSISLPC